MLSGASLSIGDTSTHDESDGKTTYFLALCDAEDIGGEDLIGVWLKEGKFDEFLMSVNLPQQKITPNIKRVFRKKDLLDISSFLNQMGHELIKNGMVNSYLSMIGDMQTQKKIKTHIHNSSSYSANLPF